MIQHKYYSDDDSHVVIFTNLEDDIKKFDGSYAISSRKKSNEECGNTPHLFSTLYAFFKYYAGREWEFVEGRFDTLSALAKYPGFGRDGCDLWVYNSKYNKHLRLGLEDFQAIQRKGNK